MARIWSQAGLIPKSKQLRAVHCTVIPSPQTECLLFIFQGTNFLCNSLESESSLLCYIYFMFLIYWNNRKERKKEDKRRERLMQVKSVFEGFSSYFSTGWYTSVLKNYLYSFCNQFVNHVLVTDFWAHLPETLRQPLTNTNKSVCKSSLLLFMDSIM